jgi:hypothetical protein
MRRKWNVGSFDKAAKVVHREAPAGSDRVLIGPALIYSPTEDVKRLAEFPW